MGDGLQVAAALGLPGRGDVLAGPEARAAFGLNCPEERLGTRDLGGDGGVQGVSGCGGLGTDVLTRLGWVQDTESAGTEAK